MEYVVWVNGSHKPLRAFIYIYILCSENKGAAVIYPMVSRRNSRQVWTAPHCHNRMLTYICLCLITTSGCNLRKVWPFFTFSADCISSSASSSCLFLNSIMQSRKSFRTSPCFSLITKVTNRQSIRNALQIYASVLNVLQTVMCTTCRPNLNLIFTR